jgi:DNA-binding CsgD family transcriptional regulator
MALQELSNVMPADVVKLFQFHRTLVQNFDSFVAATVKCLNDLFDYPISTYTIFDDDMNGARYNRNNYSNYFSNLDLHFYESEGIKSDASFLNSRIDWASNATKYIFVTEFRVPSASSYERKMLERGIRWQIRLGSHSRASAPLHVLSVYRPLHCEALSEYEQQLLSAVGQVFSECVGQYKKYERIQKDAFMYMHYLDLEKKGIAFFDPYGNTLSYNQTFLPYAARVDPEKTVSALINVLIAHHQQATETAPLKMAHAVTTKVNDCLVAVERQQMGRQYNYMPYYLITISDAPPETAAKSSVRKWQSAYHLTPREVEVAELIEEGLNNKRIAERLFISMPTVKTHIKNILSKFGVSSRTELLDRLQE